MDFGDHVIQYSNLVFDVTEAQRGRQMLQRMFLVKWVKTCILCHTPVLFPNIICVCANIVKNSDKITQEVNSNSNKKFEACRVVWLRFYEHHVEGVII